MILAVIEEVLKEACLRLNKIESASNPLIKEAVSIRDKRSKYRHRAFIIEGKHLIESALKSRAPLKRVFATGGFFSRGINRTLITGLLKTGAEVYEVSGYILKKISDAETPQGIAGIASYNPASLDELSFTGKPLVVICDGIQEPGNLGAIVRTSDAFGADAVVLLPGTCDAFSPKTLRATAGSIFNIPIIYEETDSLVWWLKSKKITLAAASPRADRVIFDVKFNIPLAVVLGNESKGVSAGILRASDVSFRIPIPGGAESLNAASSLAVCLYEVMMQRMRDSAI
jgi:TrmH family RNA methyltransferase